jgi:hypothetical protein
MVSSVCALVVYRGGGVSWLGGWGGGRGERGERRGLYRKSGGANAEGGVGSSRVNRERTVVADTGSDSDSDSDSDWGDGDGWGDGWADEDDWDDDEDGGHGGKSAETARLVDDGQGQKRVKTVKRAKRDAKRATATTAGKHGGNARGGGGAPGSGQVVLEMSDLAHLVQEARKGRGRFKHRGGKSSRTPSRESSPQRKARLSSKAGSKSTGKGASDVRENKILGLLGGYLGGIKTSGSSGGASGGAGGGTSILRDDIANTTHSPEQVAAAVSYLREAAARRHPDNPEAALRAALEVAGEGDAGLIRQALEKGFQVARPHEGASFTLDEDEG